MVAALRSRPRGANPLKIDPARNHQSQAGIDMLKENDLSFGLVDHALSVLLAAGHNFRAAAAATRDSSAAHPTSLATSGLHQSEIAVSQNSTTTYHPVFLRDRAQGNPVCHRFCVLKLRAEPDVDGHSHTVGRSTGSTA
jgi:hypothetical protein